MSKLHYRSATPADLNWLVETERKCFSQHDIFPRRNFKRILTNPNNSTIFDLIQVSDQLLIGYALYLRRRNSNKIRLYSLCLLPEYSGQGLSAVYLMKRFKDFAADFAQVTLEVRPSNQRALSLYYNLGFVVKRLRNNYYPDGEDAYHMVKTLKIF